MGDYRGMKEPNNLSETLDKIKAACQAILQSDTRERESIMEIYRLACAVDYLEEPRKLMRIHFERYQALKQHRKSEEAWELVRDDIYRLHVSAGSR
jgi:hypothetical protein